jgi:hypothetical protein
MGVFERALEELKQKGIPKVSSRFYGDQETFFVDYVDAEGDILATVRYDRVTEEPREIM